MRSPDDVRDGCATAGRARSRARAYRERLGCGRRPAWASRCRQMVDADVSGVMFTCNPVSGDPSTVAINASWGLGLAVVGGEVTPDEYLLSKVTGEVVKQTLGDKHLEYRPGRRAGARGSGAGVACLDAEQLADLLAVAKRIEAPFRHATRTSSGRSRAGELFVLQARPVTVERDARRAGGVGHGDGHGHVRRGPHGAQLTTTCARSCGSSTSPSSTSCRSRRRGSTLHVRRGRPERAARRRRRQRRRPPARSPAPMLGTFYRARARPASRRSWRSATRSSPTPSSA